MLDKLEKKLGKYAINNLIVYLLCGYGIGYLLLFGQRFTGVPYLSFMTLEPQLILQGQVWRVISWVLVPPSSLSLWTIIMFMLYYQLGSVLERTWGAFKFNVYILGGIIFTVLGAFIVYFFFPPLLGGVIPLSIGQYFSTYYINLSIFLAFSACFPDMQVLLYFIIPIKMKWMSIFYLAIVGFNVFQYVRAGEWCAAVPIIASLLNFFIFWLMTRKYNRYNPKEIHRRAEFKRQATPPRSTYRDGTPIAKHKCAVCGRTEITNPELEFRFCSKCNGNYEYCSDHLFTHKHVE